VRGPVRRPELYRMALTCPSALSAGRRVDESYERLEFLGDAVLSTVIRQKLLRTFPDQDEVRAAGCHDVSTSCNVDMMKLTSVVIMLAQHCIAMSQHSASLFNGMHMCHKPALAAQ